MTKNLVIEISDFIMQIRINRPEKKNALTRDMYRALTRALKEADKSDQVRVILITGTNDCFTAGNDLADFLDDAETGEENPMLHFVSTLPFVKKPVVAAVQGVAIGVGTTLLLHCDLVFASENARFQMPFLDLGLVPEGGSTLLLPQLVGHRKAAELLLLGQEFGAETAVQLGIANRVCNNDATLKTAIAAAKKMVAYSQRILKTTKSLMKEHQNNELRNRIEKETQHFLSCLKSPETRKTLQDLLSKLQSV